MHLRTLPLLLACLILSCFTYAQSARLAMFPTEVRIKGGNLVVENHTLVVVPDQNYTIGAVGRIFVLPETTIPRLLKLPAASEYPLREITILDKTAGEKRWTITGGFVTKAQVGVPPYNPEDSVEVPKNTKIVLFSDGNKWYDINLGGSGGTGIATPPKVDAGENRVLPSNATQVTLTANVTIGNTPLYTTAWEVLLTAPGSNITVSDTTNNTLTVTNMIPGPYTFKVTVTDDLGLRAIDSVKVFINTPARMFSSGGYANNVYDTSTGRQAWVYLPDGYNPEDTVKYPVVIFLHGGGENYALKGSIDGVLASTGGLPYFLSIGAFPMESIVIMPQLTSGFWTGEKVKVAYDYVAAGYKMDPDRVYVTGLSSGGTGAADAMYYNTSLYAAFISIAPQYTALQFPGNAAAMRDIPGMFVHGYIDPTSQIAISIQAYTNIINAGPPKGFYPTQFRTLWNGDHLPPTWNNEVYDKRIAPFDFEKDFFLMFNRNKVKTATNFVERAERYNDYNEYAMAKRLVDRLPSSASKTALLARLATKLTVITTGQQFYIIDPGLSSNTEVVNTNKLISAVPNTQKQNLVSVTGAASDIDLTVVSSAETNMIDSCPRHDYFGLVENIYRDGLKVTGAGSVLKLSSLTAGKNYNLRIFYSNMSPTRDFRTGLRVTAGGRTDISIEDGFNTSRYIELYNLVPDGSGELSIELTPQFGYYGIVNAIMLKEKAAATPIVSKFNFSQFYMDIPGWHSVNGDAAAQVIEVTDESTGWLLSTVNTAYWGRIGGATGSDSLGMNVGPYSPEFPADVVKSYMVNNDIAFNGTNFGIEIKGADGQGLAAGTYQVKLISSARSPWDLGTSEYNVKFGSGPTQRKTLAPKDNSNQFLSYTGTVLQGETIRISLNKIMPNSSTMAFINGLIIEKLD